MNATKRPRSAPEQFAPLKVASKENGATADAYTPHQQLLDAMEETLKSSSDGKCIVYWMRMSDLRMKDNRALSAASREAVKRKVPLIVLFIVSPQDYIAHDRAARKIDFVLRNVAHLKSQFADLHIPLHAVTCDVRRTIVSRVIDLLDTLGCNQIFANIEYEVDELRRDINLCKQAKKSGKQVHLFHNKNVVEPGIIRSQGTGKPYAVYSPYQRQWVQVINNDIQRYLDACDDPKANNASVRDCPLLGPLFSTPVPTFVEGFELDNDHALSMKELWPEGEYTAAEMLRRFIRTKARASQSQATGPLTEGAVEHDRFNRISKYHTERDQVDKDNTSRLSPYLSAGIISIREVMRIVMAVDGLKKLDNNGKSGVGRFIQELAWRDFYTDVLASFPRVSMGRPFLEKYADVAWENHQLPGGDANSNADMDAEALVRWKTGTTGVPVVDAAMRCLNTIGWMHNRMRMIVAMYLTKNLMIDWRVGEKYFMQHLIDGDLSSNNGGWQWSASTGVDPCPYFRIFNPYNQSNKADPTGDFIRHWVPELSKVRGPDLHNPPASLARKLNYPLPIIDHKIARERAMRRYKNPGDL